MFFRQQQDTIKLSIIILPLTPSPRREASISSTISELRHDDLEKEVEEEKKLRLMAESQRDEALKSVEDLRQSLAKNRAKLKVCVREKHKSAHTQTMLYVRSWQ